MKGRLDYVLLLPHFWHTAAYSLRHSPLFNSKTLNFPTSLPALSEPFNEICGKVFASCMKAFIYMHTTIGHS